MAVAISIAVILAQVPNPSFKYLIFTLYFCFLHFDF